MPLTYLAVIAAFILSGCGKLGPNGTFQECLLENARTATDIQVVNYLRNVCVEKYQKLLPPVEQEKLEGIAKISFGSIFVTLKNRTSDWTITQLEIQVKVLSDPPEIHNYLSSASFNTEPLSEGTFIFNSESDLKGNDINWNIARAYAIQTRP